MRTRQTFAALHAGLGSAFRLDAIDFHGHGDSARWPGHYRVVDYAFATVDWLRRNGNEPIVIYGHSLGAMVAAGAAAALPDRVRAIVLEDPPFHTMGSRIEQTAWHGYFSAVYRLVQRDGFAAAPLEQQAQLLADLEVPDPITRRPRRLGEMRQASAIRFLASSLGRLDPEVLAPVVAGKWLEGYDEREIARQVICPVLLLQADPTAGGALTDEDAASFAALAAKATLVKLAGAGHNMHIDRTQDVIDLITLFLRKKDRGVA
jgi:pimeloyl-ACP methyl ester carboxylesterase